MRRALRVLRVTTVCVRTKNYELIDMGILGSSGLWVLMTCCHGETGASFQTQLHKT